MANERLIHDVAFAASQGVLEVFAGCLREEERRDAFAEIFDRVKAAIERFEVQSDRMARRLHPGRN